MSGQHSELSPSSSERWINCPGSVRRVRELKTALLAAAAVAPLDAERAALLAEIIADTSDAAEKGTDGHDLAALCLAVDVDADTLLGKTMPNGYVADEAMTTGVQQYLDYVRPLPGEHLVEEWLDGSRLTGERGGGGTADHVAIAPAELYVTDLKMGRSPVEIAGNTQTRTYAAYAALRRAPGETPTVPERVVMAIVQPLVFSVPQVETISGSELMVWVNTVLIPAAAATLDPDAPLVPGDKQCQWCRAKGDCPALTQCAVATTGAADLVEFSGSFVPPAPSGLSGSQLSAILAKASLVEKWLEACRAEMATRLLIDGDAADWKLVRGKRGNKAWTGDEDAITAVLRNNYGLANETIFKMTMLTPTAILALPAVKAAPDLLAAFITQKEGGLTPAPGTDKRAAAFPGELLAAEFTTID